MKRHEKRELAIFKEIQYMRLEAELASVAPNMTVLADREGVFLGCEYN